MTEKNHNPQEEDAAKSPLEPKENATPKADQPAKAPEGSPSEADPSVEDQQGEPGEADAVMANQDLPRPAESARGETRGDDSPSGADESAAETEPNKQLPEPGERPENEMTSDEPPRPSQAGRGDSKEEIPTPPEAPSPLEQAHPQADQNPSTSDEPPPRTPEVKAGEIPKPTTPASLPPGVSEQKTAPEDISRPSAAPEEPAKVGGQGATSSGQDKKSRPFSQAARDLADAAKSRVQSLRESSQKAAGDKKADFQEKQKHLRLQLEEKAEHFNRAAVDAVDSAWTKAGDYRRRGEETLRKEPLKSVGIAAAAGFVLALLFTGRRR